MLKSSGHRWGHASLGAVTGVATPPDRSQPSPPHLHDKPIPVPGRQALRATAEASARPPARAILVSVGGRGPRARRRERAVGERWLRSTAGPSSAMVAQCGRPRGGPVSVGDGTHQTSPTDLATLVTKTIAHEPSPTLVSARQPSPSFVHAHTRTTPTCFSGPRMRSCSCKVSGWKVYYPNDHFTRFYYTLRRRLSTHRYFLLPLAALDRL
jgi:hypothetical protein